MFREMLNPDLYHGRLPWNKFEGWYFRISDGRELSLAIIPGILMGKEHSHSFIQFLMNKDNTLSYFKMPKESFNTNHIPFYISIEDNFFSFDSIKLNLRSDNLIVKADLVLSDIKKWNPTSSSHRSMGYYNFIPFMECYSQVCSIDLKVTGQISVNNNTYLIENGNGYIEKNWGNAFPYSWIWIQSNNFTNGNTAITASIGHIPFPLGSFRGFLIGLLHKDLFYSFTTMNGSKISINKYNNDICIFVENKKYSLEIKTLSYPNKYFLLKAPKKGQMIDMVRETLSAEVYIKLIEKASNQIIVEDKGYNTGIEYGGEQMKILD